MHTGPKVTTQPTALPRPPTLGYDHWAARARAFGVDEQEIEANLDELGIHPDRTPFTGSFGARASFGGAISSCFSDEHFGVPPPAAAAVGANPSTLPMGAAAPSQEASEVQESVVASSTSPATYGIRATPLQEIAWNAIDINCDFELPKSISKSFAPWYLRWLPRCLLPKRMCPRRWSEVAQRWLPSYVGQRRTLPLLTDHYFAARSTRVGTIATNNVLTRKAQRIFPGRPQPKANYDASLEATLPQPREWFASGADKYRTLESKQDFQARMLVQGALIRAQMNNPEILAGAVGLQEVSELRHLKAGIFGESTSRRGLESDRYGFVLPQSGRIKGSSAVIVYDKQKFTREALPDSAAALVTRIGAALCPESSQGRKIAAAYLRSRETGEMVLMINVHADYDRANAPGVLTGVMAELRASAFAEQFVLAGDLNVRVSREPTLFSRQVGTAFVEAPGTLLHDAHALRRLLGSTTAPTSMPSTLDAILVPTDHVSEVAEPGSGRNVVLMECERLA